MSVDDLPPPVKLMKTTKAPMDTTLYTDTNKAGNKRLSGDDTCQANFIPEEQHLSARQKERRLPTNLQRWRVMTVG